MKDELDQLIKSAATLPDQLQGIWGRRVELHAQMKALQKKGMVNATAHFKDQRYMLLISPTQADGSRPREYIGANLDKQQEALQRVERFKQHQALSSELHILERYVSEARRHFDSLEYSLNACTGVRKKGRA